MKRLLLLPMLLMGLLFSATGQISCPPNIDFELGSLSDWNFYTGTCCPINTPTAGIVSGRHTLTSGSGVDPLGLFPVVYPDGYSHSLQIGNSGTGRQAEKATYNVRVPSTLSNYSIIYRYAVVLQDPGHTASDQPRFQVTVRDSATGQLLPCAQATYVPSGGVPGFTRSSVRSDTWFHDWGTGTLDLSNYSGRTITVEFASGDCALSGHFGYGYVDMSCGLFATAIVVCGATTATLTSPGGFASYQWYDSSTFTTSYGTGQTVTITVPTVISHYAVILTPYSGFGCPDTLYTTLVPMRLELHPSNDTTICPGASITITSGATDISLPLTYSWSTPTSGLSCTTCDNPVVTPTVSTSYRVIVHDAGGCVAFDTINVSLIRIGAITGPSTIFPGGTITLADTTAGGVWTSSNTGVATVGSSSGVVTGVGAGTTTITYSVTNVCGIMRETFVVTVGSPAAALSFDGVNDQMQSAANTSLDVTTQTVEFWMKPNGAVNNSMILGKRNPAISGTSGTRWSIHLRTGLAGLIFYSPAGSGTFGYSFTAGTWYHVAMVTTPTATTLYVNGTLVGTVGTAIYTAVVNTPVLMGMAYTASLQEPYNGLLDDVRIWTTARTCGEIEGYKNCELTGTETGLGAYYNFNQGVAGLNNSTITTAFDATSSAINCNLSSFALNGSTSNWVAPGAVASGGVCSGVVIPTIAAKGNNNTITNGSTTTTTSNFTDFGGVVVAVPTTRTYKIYNTGTGMLRLTGTPKVTFAGTAAADYSVSTMPADSIAGGDSTTLVVAVTASATGTRNATVLMTTNTCDATTFKFNVTASAACVAPDVPTLSASIDSICNGSPTTISITAGALNNATQWKWYTGSCGGTLVDTGISATLSPTVTTTYYVRGEGGCTTPGSCASVTVMVFPVPSSIMGAGAVCEGGTISLSNTAAGGSWVSSNTAVATVSSAGVVSTIIAGTSIISYVTFCGTVTKTVTANPLPTTFTGTPVVCEGSSTLLGNSISGGTWMSGSTSIATVSSSGVVFGVSTGSANITYTTAAGCDASINVVVNPTPSISGPSTVCQGVPTTFSASLSGGSWASSVSTVATVNSTSGVVTGLVSSSTVPVISYTLPTGCRATTSVSVSLFAGITGPTGVCIGRTITLGNTITGGTWSSSDPSVASISTTGVVSGLSAGTTTVSYSGISGCVATSIISVFATPSISGPSIVCAGQTITLTSTVSGGTWASSNSVIAAIGSTSGIVYGAMASSVVPNITYTVPGGCVATTTVSVITMPAITGTNVMCEGQSVTLANTASGGTWASADASIASVGTTGIVAGVAAGVTSISYTLPSGCVAFRTVTINAMPSAIIGGGGMCVGSTITLSNTVAGGVWTSSAPTIANVGSTGSVYGVSASSIIPTISYTMPGSCRATVTVTVGALPAAISGVATVCSNATTTLSTTTTVGTWSSSNMSVATVGSTGIGSRGVVYAVANGTSTISYTNATGCSSIKVVTVSTGPGPILGAGSICLGQSLSLSNSVSGGTWTSSSPTIASVNASTGVVTASASLTGSPTISYTMPGGCRATASVPVVSLGAITGSTALCTGETKSLYNATAGGSWTSSDPSVATVTAGGLYGLVSGVAAGTAVMSYTIPSGCFRTATVTVSAGAGPITGAGAVCLGRTITLSNSVPGGVWTSSHSTVASIGSLTGIVTGLAASSTVPTISYSMPGGCRATATVTVVPMYAITGTGAVCQGSSITLGNAVTGGTWLSSDATVASISLTGVISGLSAGSVDITYTTGAGCATTKGVTVNPIAAITGAGAVCTGDNLTLSNAVSGGVWASSHVAIATIGSASGIVFPVAPSSVRTTITYTLPSGCRDTAQVLVVSLAAIGGVTSTVCVGQTIVYTNAALGGVWATSNGSIATIGSSSGVIQGLVAGSATISYSIGSSSCVVTKSVQVSHFAEIIGPTELCQGSTITLTNPVSGGVWSSRYVSLATVDATSGVVFGVSGSGAMNTITYTIGGGCSDTALLQMHYNAPITGPTTVCEGTSVHLGNLHAGGMWTSASTTVASVGTGTGDVVGMGVGSTTISYQLPTGCLSLHTMSVHPAVAAITGPGSLCVTTTITLANTDGGGTWTSSNPGIATVGASSGIVSGAAASSVPAIITYTLPTTCRTTASILVNSCGRAFSGDEEGGVIPDAGAGFTLIPNPNGGTFSIKGSFGRQADEDISVVMVNMLGQVMYRDVVLAKDGLLNHKVVLSEAIANGSYIVSLKAGSDTKVFHIVIER